VVLNQSEIPITINNQGKKVEVTVNVTNVNELYAWEIHMWFNTSTAIFERCYLPPDNIFSYSYPLLLPPVVDDLEFGEVTLGCSLVGEATPSFSGSGKMVNVEFMAIGQIGSRVTIKFILSFERSGAMISGIRLVNRDAHNIVPVNYDTDQAMIYYPELSVNVFSDKDLTKPIGKEENITFYSEVNGGMKPYSYFWYVNGQLFEPSKQDNVTISFSKEDNYYVYLEVYDYYDNKAWSEYKYFTIIPEYSQIFVLVFMITTTLIALLYKRSVNIDEKDT